MKETAAKRLLILCSTTGYQTSAFVEAASRARVDVMFGSDRCHVLNDPWRDGAVTVRFDDPDESARLIIELARRTPIDAIIGIGDGPASVAARASQSLGLPGHSPEAAEICRDKHRSRTRLAAAGVKVPCFARFAVEDDPHQIATSPGGGNHLAVAGIGFPCVLKPLALSASTGVIRANDAEEFENAFARIRRLLRSPDVQARHESQSGFIQIESYLEGAEIAVEAIMDSGRLHLLAIFDKPDPLAGPYFEETIYITPSRLPAATQATVAETLDRAVQAIGLFYGPVHAEFRINAEGVWVLEVAARSIGGICSRALRLYDPDLRRELSLEEALIRLALGFDATRFRREDRAAGVMMIPVPDAGILERVTGMEDGRKIEGVEDVVITAKPGERLVPLPEGSSYPGFIFARADSPQRVEAALREAHGKLRFHLARALPVLDRTHGN